MNYSNSWYEYASNLQQYLKQMDAKLQQLEQRISQLETNGVNAKHTNIEKLEYHFDQLKIERLDGTLHIGLTPEDLGKVDSMAINQVPPTETTQKQQPMQQQLVSQLDSYVMEEGPGYVEQLAYEHGYPINDHYKTMIVNDVRKQLPTRVAHYTTEAKQQNGIQDEQKLGQFVFAEVQKEITYSLRQFFQNDSNKGEKS